MAVAPPPPDVAEPALKPVPEPLPAPPGSAGALAFVAAILLGLVGLALTATGLLRSYLASDWAQATAVVTRARVLRSTEPPDRFDIQYRYEVDGEVFVGDSMSHTELWGPGSSDDLLRRFPMGAEVPIFYDPSDPTRSILEREVPVTYWVVLAASLIAFSWGMACWILRVRQENAAEL